MNMPELGITDSIRGAEDYLSRQAEFESAARSYPRGLPIVPESARGIVVTDIEGRQFLDCLAGAGALALGHNHPVALHAMRELFERCAPLQILDFTTTVKEEFVEQLLETLPAPLRRIQFCGPAGADAVEAALKLVKTATGRRSVMAFRGGFHGMTHGALALMGNLGPKQSITGLMADVHFLPYPYTYRCPFGLGGQAGEQMSWQYLERLLDDPLSGIVEPAAVILEPVQGEGGVVPASPEWLQAVRRITRERGIALIADEVQTGWGRTGNLYAFEQAGIVPDVLVLSKAIGGGLPLALIAYDEALDTWKPGAHSGTFRGNQLAMAAGRATLDFLLREDLAAHAAAQGGRLMAHLQALQDKHPCLGDVRGRGLMLGVEIVDTSAQADKLGSYPSAPKLARRIQSEALQRGLILELGGCHGSVVRFLPPLIVTSEQVDEIASRFAAAVEAAAINVPGEVH